MIPKRKTAVRSDAPASGQLRRKKPLIEGAVVPIVTPVRSDGEADHDGLARLARWLVAKGVDGIFVGGTTGRFSDFTPEQNAEMCQVVADAVDGDATIYGGICDSGPHRMIANAERMAKAGADAVVTTGPYYLPRAQREIETTLECVADRSPLSVVFYNQPDLVGYGLRAEWVGEIAQHPNVAGYKDSSNNCQHLLEVLRLTRDKDFGVLVGKEVLLADALRAGAKGFVVSFLQAEPDLFVALMNKGRVGDWKAVGIHQARITRMVEEFLVEYKRHPVFSTLLTRLEARIRRHGLAIRLLAPPRRIRGRQSALCAQPR